jgi:acetyl esterase
MDDMVKNLPGRLGNPDMALGDDPRADPRLIAAISPFGLDQVVPPPPVTNASSEEEIHAFCGANEAGNGDAFAILFSGLPDLDVQRYTETIRGVDGNDIELHIHRPQKTAGHVPVIVHLHGGGMAVAAAADPQYVRWRDELAAVGLIVVGVEFRNASGKLGNHPFPAGLNDCASGVQWTFDNKAVLGISKIIVSGESGGGNLSLATALLANREGWIDKIDGVYAQCPYISNAYAEGDPSLPSLVENDGYFLSSAMMAPLAKIYDPTFENVKNPLAWPLHAESSDLEGLPPHVISVNELDPLRDEGLAYYRKLLAQAVPTVGRTVSGTCHGGDILTRRSMPEVFAASIADLRSFAFSL